MIKCPSRAEALDKRKGHLLDYVSNAMNFIPASRRWGRIFNKLQTRKEKHERIEVWGIFFFPLFITHRSLPCPSATIPALETTGEMSQITQIKWDGGPNARCREHKSPLVRSLQLLSTEPTHGARWEFQAATPSAHASTRLAHTWGRVNTPRGLQRLCWLHGTATGRKSHPPTASFCFL